MKKSMFAFTIILILLFGIGIGYLIANKNSNNIKTNNSQNISCNINNVILNFKNSSKDNLPQYYDADSIDKCRYNNQDIYIFGVGCCDRTTTIYDSDCNLLASAGGFLYRESGDFYQIIGNKTNCETLWSRE